MIGSLRALLQRSFDAPQSTIPIFSFVAPGLMEEVLVALPTRVLQQTPRDPSVSFDNGAGGMAGREPHACGSPCVPSKCDVTTWEAIEIIPIGDCNAVPVSGGLTSAVVPVDLGNGEHAGIRNWLRWQWAILEV